MNSTKTIQTINLGDMLTDASIDRVMAIDAEWNIIAWNRTAEQLTGIKKEDITGKPLLEIFPDLAQDTEIMQALKYAMRGKRVFVPAKTGAFNRDTYENHFMPIEDEDGAILGAMNIMHDVAHRIKAERQLERLNDTLRKQFRQLQKANTELASFTSITGNDLKEPIKKVYTTLELIIKTDGPKLSDNSKAALRRMQSSINRVNLLLDDILALSTAAGFDQEFEQIDLNVVLQEALESLYGKITEKQARIETEQLPVVSGSRQMLQYLFSNLLSNALKFQPADNIPTIKIRVDIVTGNTVPEGVTGKEKNYVAVSFIDNGIGFDQSDAERIFNMFEKLHPRNVYGGSGIGLTLSQKIAEAHDGYIEAKSVKGKGSTFTCFLAMNRSALPADR
jgi:PAS domain S-box-containing protein